MKPLSMFPPKATRSEVAALFGKRSDSFLRTMRQNQPLIIKLDELGAIRYGRTWNRAQLQAIDHFIGLPDSFFQVINSQNKTQ